MSSRVCKKCSESKPAASFHGRLCKECKLLQNKLRKRALKSQSIVSDSLSGNNLVIYQKLNETSNMVISGSHNEDFDEIVENLREIFDVIEESKNKTLAFSHNVSKETQNFLQKVHDGDGDIGSAENMMRRNINNINKPAFLETFELNPETIDAVYDEVIKIKESMDAVKSAYNIMINKANKHDSMILDYVGSDSEYLRKAKADATFDLRKNEIVLEPNDLQYNTETFKKELTELIKSGNFVIKSYKSCGGFDFLM